MQLDGSRLLLTVLTLSGEDREVVVRDDDEAQDENTQQALSENYFVVQINVDGRLKYGQLS